MKEKVLSAIICIVSLLSASCERTSTDKTAQLAEAGKVMSLNRAWNTARHDDGRDYLSVAHPGAPGDVPPGTDFRITKLQSGYVTGGGPYNHLTIEIIDGDHKGKVFDRVSAMELYDNCHGIQEPKVFVLKTDLFEKAP